MNSLTRESTSPSLLVTSLTCWPIKKDLWGYYLRGLFVYSGNRALGSLDWIIRKYRYNAARYPRTNLSEGDQCSNYNNSIVLRATRRTSAATAPTPYRAANSANFTNATTATPTSQLLGQVIEQTGDLTLLTDGERSYGNLLFEICQEALRTGKPGRPRKTLPKGVKVRIKNKGSQVHKRGRKRPKYQAPLSLSDIFRIQYAH
jgi:hypothetical protein